MNMIMNSQLLGADLFEIYMKKLTEIMSKYDVRA